MRVELVYMCMVKVLCYLAYVLKTSMLSCREVWVQEDVGYQSKQCYNAVIHGETNNWGWMLPGSRIIMEPQKIGSGALQICPNIVNDAVIGMGKGQLGTLSIQLSNRTFKYYREIDTWSDFGLSHMK